MRNKVQEIVIQAVAGTKDLTESIDELCVLLDVRHCAFQYWNGRKMVKDKSELTLVEAKNLWNEYYSDMVEKTEESDNIEVAIWINMKDESDYQETLIHLSAPEVRNGKLYEPKYYDVF